MNTMEASITRPGSAKLNSSIMVCGCGRSGTTIMGKLIGSFDNVEYIFDPPLIHTLIYYIGKTDDQMWKNIFESYLYSDFFLNALAGRNLNFNRNDDSCVFNTKSETEIAERLKKSWGRNELLEISNDKRIAFKVTDLVCRIREIKNIYPESKIIAMYRNPVDTINSIIEKKWFTGDAIKTTSPEPMNFRLIYNNVWMPLWVREEDYDFWIGTTEQNRAAYYFVATNNSLLNNIGKVHVVSYDRFVNAPTETAGSIARLLGVRNGTGTNAIINSVSPRKKKSAGYLKPVSPEYLAKIDAIVKNFSARGIE